MLKAQTLSPITAIILTFLSDKVRVVLNCRIGCHSTRLTICLIISMSIELMAVGQTLHHSLTTRYNGIGVYSKNFVDVQSVSSNQAALPNIESIAASVYCEKRFLLNEVNLYALTSCVPFEFGAVGLFAKYFGYSEYNETQLGVAYGKTLGKINIGIQFNYHSLRIQAYGKDASFTLEAAALTRLSEQVVAGVHIFNPTGSGFGNNKLEKLPRVYTAGLGYEASQKVYVGAEIIKVEDRSIGINASIQYVFAKKLFARVGLYTETTNLYFGLGWKWQTLRIDITTSYHPQLGISPGLLLLFDSFNKDE